MRMDSNMELNAFLKGKSEHTLKLFHYFIEKYKEVGEITIDPTKSMIGISNSKRKIVWITHFGKNFIHVVFPFKKAYTDNLSFQKIAEVPGKTKQFNHHFRMYFTEDINKEVIQFMKLAYKDSE